MKLHWNVAIGIAAFLVSAACGSENDEIPRCTLNSKILREKIDQKAAAKKVAPRNGIVISVYAEQYVLDSTNTLTISVLLTKHYNDPDFFYADDNPCDDYGIVQLSNATAFKAPDIYLVAGILLNDKTPESVIVFSNGTVLASQRLQFSTLCASVPHRAFGILTCQYVWHNLNYKHTNMTVEWSDNMQQVAAKGADKYNLINNYYVSGLSYRHHVIANDTDELLFEVKLEQIRHSEVFNFYLPQIILSCFCWFSIFLGPHPTTRAVVIVGSVLMMLLQSAVHLRTVNSNYHVSHYDVWRGGMLFFTASCLLELIIVTMIATIYTNRLRAAAVEASAVRCRGDGTPIDMPPRYVSRRRYRNNAYEPVYEEPSDVVYQQLSHDDEQQTLIFPRAATIIDMTSLVVFGVTYIVCSVLFFVDTPAVVGITMSILQYFFS